MKISTNLAFGALCLVLSVIVLGAEAGPSARDRSQRRQVKKTRKELSRALRAKRLLMRRSWFGPVEQANDCSLSGMEEQGMEVQMENRPFALCEKVRKN